MNSDAQRTQAIALGLYESADIDVLARAGEVALQIAQLPQEASTPRALASQLASLLLSRLDLDFTLLFEIPSSNSPHTTLRELASAARIGAIPKGQSRRMAACAHRALRRGALVTRSYTSHTAHAEHDTTICQVVTAIPLGWPIPTTVCVASWQAPAHEVAPLQQSRQALMEALTPSLALVAQFAHASQDSAQSTYLRQRRNTIFSISSEPILTIGEDFIIRETNPAFDHTIGSAHHDAAGKHCSEVIRCRDEHSIPLCNTTRCPLRHALSSSDTRIWDLEWETASGKRLDISASVSAPHVGNERVAIFVARDVTTRNSASRGRANFISMVSHELRTPLNSINGFLEIVLEGQVGALNERQQEFLNYAFVSTHQLMTLVEDILFISKADAGQFKLRRSSVDVALLMEQAAHSALQVADKAGIPLLADIPSDPIQMRGDELRLLQVLNNLLGNAIKFSPAGTSVRLSATIAGSDICFTVTDRGKGISPEERERIFDRFYQADSNARSRGEGYGLGLAIAKLIVEQHGGRIWVDSKPDDATTFFVSLPLTGPDSTV